MEWLTKKVAEKAFYYLSFEINGDQKNRLLEKIIQERDGGDINYVQFGNQQTFLGGSIGSALSSASSTSSQSASISASSPSSQPASSSFNSTSLQTASVKSNDSTLGKSDNSASQTSHNSVDASLRKGHSCVSWAVASVRFVVPSYEYQPTVLGRLFVMVPQYELNQEGANAPKPRRCAIS
jgi:hypothetical protein